MSSPTPDEYLSWHEAGHAVVARLLGGHVRLVTLEQDDDGVGGMASIEWPVKSDAGCADLSGRVALAGPLAEIERFGAFDPGDLRVLAAWEMDWAEVDRCATALRSTDEGREALIRSWVEDVRQIVGDPDVEERIARVAEMLDAHGTLDEDLLDECY